MLIRPAQPSDLDRIAWIQSRVPECAHWNPADYLAQSCWVAESDGVVRGYIAARQILADEFEILDVAVEASARNCGIGRALVKRVRAELTGAGFLEVRESNHGAQHLYASCGWRAVGRRKEYYVDPLEDAVVMKI